MSVGFKPHPGPQEKALRVPDTVFEILLGGSRGGGKTTAGIYWLIKPIEGLDWNPTVTHAQFRALVLRRNANDMTDWIDRADFVYKNYGGRLVKHPQPYWTFPSGAKIYVGHLKDADSYTKYQGHEYQRVLIEELTQIKSEMLYTKLIGSCRSTIAEIKAQIFLTTNPGGVGHSWVRNRFINASPPDRFFTNIKTDRPAIFIPAGVDDNPSLREADPGYIKWLDSLKETDEKLWMAWRHGDWDQFEGQIFTEWNYKKHVFQKFWFSLNDCEKICSFDWGYNDPASMSWLARSPENKYGVQHIFMYREVYRNQMTPLQWGQLMKRIQSVDPVEYMVLPHDCFSTRKGEETIATVLQRESGIPVRQADSLKKGAKLNRISIMHQVLSDTPDGFPYMMVHESCSNFIRTIPELVYDEVMVEEINRNAEEHSFDSCLVADTLVDTDSGQVRIVDLVGTTGKLWSIDGLQNYHSVRQTGHRQTYKLFLENDKTITATDNHPFMTRRGWVELGSLRPDDMIRLVYAGEHSQQNSARIQWREILPWQRLRRILPTYKQALSWGSKITSSGISVPQRRDTKRRPHPPQGSQQSQQPNREPHAIVWDGTPRLSRKASGAQGTPTEACSQNTSTSKGVAWFTAGQRLASSALSKYEAQTERGSRGKATREKISFYVRTVWSRVRYFLQMGETLQPEMYAAISRLEKAEKQPVYNLEVENTECFSVNGGVLVHNCTYGLMTLKPRIVNSDLVSIGRTQRPVFGPASWNVRDDGTVEVQNVMAASAQEQIITTNPEM